MESKMRKKEKVGKSKKKPRKKVRRKKSAGRRVYISPQFKTCPNKGEREHSREKKYSFRKDNSSRAAEREGEN